jgi:hypothetical protein
MAPEQADGLEAGAPADLYSLALVIYEALTGVNPVGAGTAARRARRLGAYLPPLRRQRRDLPRELGYAIDLALRPRPRERGSVEELGEALTASLGSVGDRPGVVASPWPTETFRRRRRDPEPPALPVDPEPDELPEGSRPSIPWPRRALAAAAAAVAAGWLAGSVLAPTVPPAVAALLGGVAVAALPRIGWVALIAAAAGGLAAQGRGGASLVVVLAGLIPALLLPLRPTRWPLGVFAPMLGALGLAGAWPALAGRARGAWQRAALGASGWMLLAAAETLAATDLYTRLPHTVPPQSVWAPSPYETLHHVFGPLLSAGILAPAAVWALAAAVLPRMTSTRSLPVQVILVTTWTATTASATTVLLKAGHGGALVNPGDALLGALAAAVVALAPALEASIRGSQRADNTPTGLA